MRKAVVFTASGAVVLVAAAAVLRFAVLPNLEQVPGDLDTTLHYTGTADVVDAAALQSGNLASALRSGLPVNVAERIRSVATHGSTVVLADDTTAAAGGATLLSSRHTWAVDRTSMAAAPPPAGSSAEPHQGLVVGFPLSPKAKDYPYWDYPTQSTVTAAYQRTEKHGGTRTYVYTVHANGPLKDPAIKGGVPAALPKATLLGLAATLPADVKSGLTAQAAQLPEQIPLAYTATNDSTFWVDTGTGYVVDVTQKQTVAAAIALGPASVPLANVFALNVRFTPETVSSVGDDAAAARRGLFLLGVVAPVALLVVAALLALIAVWLWRRGRNRTSAGHRAGDGPGVPVEASTGD
jgi:hypothetical protein